MPYGRACIEERKPEQNAMAVSAGFKEFLIEILAGMGPVTIRHMFGGGGVYVDGVMFALIVEDVIYFKADDGNRPDFEAEDSEPFSYATKTGANTINSFWRCPERLLDEPEEMVAWSRRAIAAAHRAGAKKAARKPKAAKLGTPPGKTSARATKARARR